MNTETAPAAIREKASKAIFRDRNSLALHGTAIFILTMAAYLPALSAGFIWDDDHHFTENPLMAAPGGLGRIWTEHQFYYPLTSTIWWTMRRLFGLNPAPYHLLNILLHAFNAALLWRLLRRLAYPGAWLAAAVFAVHPVNVQSVAWATELKNCLSGAFYLVSLLAWTCFRENARNRQWLWYGSSLAAFLLALASKTSTVMLPFSIILIDLWTGERATLRSITRYAPYFALAALGGMLTLSGHRSMVEGSEWDLSAAQRLALAGRCVWFYMGKIFYPIDLSFVYPRWTVDAANPLAWAPFLALAASVPTLWIFRGRTWSRTTLIAFGFFIANLFPVLNFMRMYYARYSYVADHWQYLAGMGAIAWAVGGGAWLVRRHAPRLSERVIGAVLIIAFGSLTWKQAQIYQTSETLWLDVLAKNPDAEIAYNNLGAWYFDRGDLRSAEGTLRAGLLRYPGDLELETILAATLIREQRWEEPYQLMSEALARAPNDSEILNNLGLAEEGLGRNEDALQHFRRAVELDPSYIEIRVNYVQALMGMKRADEARAAIDAGERGAPGNPVWAELRAAARP